MPATKAQFMEVLSDIEVGQRSVRESMTQGCAQSVLVRSSVSNNMEMSMIRKVMMDIAVPQVRATIYKCTYQQSLFAIHSIYYSLHYTIYSLSIRR